MLDPFSPTSIYCDLYCDTIFDTCNEMVFGLVS